MSKRYKGAVISATPPTTSTSSASGVWTEQQFMQGVASGSWPALAGAPTIGTATAGALSASVAFTAPTYVGSGITGYTATSSPGGITGTGASSPVTVSGLTAGTSYTFTVTATTAAGQGPASAASNSVTPTPPNYIEDVFSTYLYNGNSSTQTITNSIDLSTQGGLVWIKARNGSGATRNHRLWTTNLTGSKVLQSDSTAALYDYGSPQVTFNTNGFDLSSDAGINATSSTYASWTFRKQPKFFDVVTYTGNGTTGKVVSHSLGSEPACIIIKLTSSAGSDWQVWHRNDGTTAKIGYLNLTSSMSNADYSSSPNLTFLRYAPTSTDFTLKASTQADASACNASGQTYIAYLFAHNAGGFGLTGTDNVISCGSCTANGSGNYSVTLGYEPQWVLIKSTGAGRWNLYDNMRGATASSGYLSAQRLQPQASDAEDTQNSPYGLGINATGFTGNAAVFSTDLIYIAIRRGPMKVPTSGTSVFTPIARTGNGTNTTLTGVGFAPDLTMTKTRAAGYYGFAWDRLRGANLNLSMSLTDAEDSTVTDALVGFDAMDGVRVGIDNNLYYINGNAQTFINWNFKRAPSFFDEVCYTGDSTAGRTITHNLGVAPEFIIVKSRSNITNWRCYVAPLGNTNIVDLDSTGASASSPTTWNSTTPTASVFTVGTNSSVNTTGRTYVAYLFATCAGVSKVGSYTGNGTTQTIDCGFDAGGARFVLIKRTDSTGGWYTYDTARGMTVLTDPYLLLNSPSAETATLGSVTTVSTGFALNSSILAAINVSAGTYIFLAIA